MSEGESIPENIGDPESTLEEQRDAQAAQAADEADEPSDAERMAIELEEANDRALRAQAELENVRKRMRRESREQLRYANMPLIRDLLPVLDNINRTIEAAEQHNDAAGLLEGVKMIADQLESVFKKHHCTQIGAVGEPFDPNLHEAISKQPSAEYAEHTVMLQTSTGFQLYDRVVRPPQVIISTGPPTGDEPSGEQ